MEKIFLLILYSIKLSTLPFLSISDFLPSAAFVLSCAFPKEPAGGEVSVTHLHAGGEAFFHCFTGYKLQGPKILTCRNATTPYWSGKEPRCVGKANCISARHMLAH